MQQGRLNIGSRRQYPSAFEESWKQYPRRDGATSKADSFHQWKRRLSEGYEAEQIHKAVLAYRLHCDRAGKTGTCYVMQFETFVGRGLHFLQNFEQPTFPRRIWKPPTERAEGLPQGYLTALLKEQLGNGRRRP